MKWWLTALLFEDCDSYCVSRALILLQSLYVQVQCCRDSFLPSIIMHGQNLGATVPCMGTHLPLLRIVLRLQNLEMTKDQSAQMKTEEMRLRLRSNFNNYCMIHSHRSLSSWSGFCRTTFSATIIHYSKNCTPIFYNQTTSKALPTPLWLQVWNK